MPTMMRDAAISFPLLGNWSIDPSASFTLFGRTFYWYGVLIWMIPLAIIGARLYYVIFQWSDYRDHPIDALKIWEGGLAIYGGVIAGLLTGIVWCRKKKIPFGAMADVCAPHGAHAPRPGDHVRTSDVSLREPVELRGLSAAALLVSTTRAEV